MSRPQTWVVAYDIADDGRREDVSSYLSGHGPRVQLSVFECILRSTAEAREMRARLRELIDTDEDQIRLYPISPDSASRAVILGAREVEERKDYWII